MRLAKVGWALATLGLTLAMAGQASAGWAQGTTLTVSIMDSPIGTNFSQNITLQDGLTTTFASIDLMVTEHIYTVSPTSQWIVFDYQTIDGAPIAGNISAYWQIQESNVQTTGPANLTQFVAYWTNNGAIQSGTGPISNSNYTTPIANPIPTRTGLVYNFPTGLPYGPATTFSAYNYVTPYSNAATGGINLSDSGFTQGLLEVDVPSTVPEPSSLLLCAIAGASGLGLSRIARRRAIA